MPGKITEYTPVGSVNNQSLSDWSFWTGLAFETRSLSYQNMVTGLNNDLTFPGSDSIYTASSFIGASRTVTLSDGAITAQDLTFSSLTDSNLLRLDATNDRVGIGILSPLETGHIAGNARIDGSTLVNQGTSISYYSGTGGMRFGGITVDAIGGGIPTVQASNGSSQGGFRAGVAGGGADILLWANSSNTNFGTISNTDLNLYTNSTVKGRFSNAGQFAWGYGSSASVSTENVEFGGRMSLRDTTTPALTAGVCKIYSKDVAGTSKLFVIDGAGAETQLN